MFSETSFHKVITFSGVPKVPNLGRFHCTRKINKNILNQTWQQNDMFQCAKCQLATITPSAHLLTQLPFPRTLPPSVYPTDQMAQLDVLMLPLIIIVSMDTKQRFGLQRCSQKFWHRKTSQRSTCFMRNTMVRHLTYFLVKTILFVVLLVTVYLSIYLYTAPYAYWIHKMMIHNLVLTYLFWHFQSIWPTEC